MPLLKLLLLPKNMSVLFVSSVDKNLNENTQKVRFQGRDYFVLKQIL